METNMLKAISIMLVGSKEPKVECAKIMLDEIIKARENKTPAPNVQPVVVDTTPKPAPPKPKRPEGQVEIVVDASKRITSIKGLPLDAKVMLDNIVMTHKEAIGKTFQSGKIL